MGVNLKQFSFIILELIAIYGTTVSLQQNSSPDEIKESLRRIFGPLTMTGAYNSNLYGRQKSNPAILGNGKPFDINTSGRKFVPIMYHVPQMPVVLPARTVFEPVVHDHPPIHKIRKMMRKKKKPRYYSSTDTDSSSSCGSDTSDSDSSVAVDYYDDFVHVNG